MTDSGARCTLKCLMSVEVPEDAIEAAKRADHKARNTAMFKASDSVSIQDDAVRAVLEAAAPLILAAAFERQASRMDDVATRRVNEDSWDRGWHAAWASWADALRERAVVLRGDQTSE